MEGQATVLVLGPDPAECWARLRETKEKLMRAGRARNTVHAYAHAWKVFCGWCSDVGVDSLPASPDTISTFIVWALYEKENGWPRGPARKRRGWRISSVSITLSAIRWYHVERELASPVTADVRQLLRNARRELREKPAGKDALTPSQLQRVSAALADGRLISVRDRAAIVLQFAAGWRASEVTSLDLADVRFGTRGMLITLGASKTDQEGREGRTVGIPAGVHYLTCPVRLLEEWIDRRGKWEGPLFCHARNNRVEDRRIQGDVICHRLKRILAKVGMDATPYGSHSLRAGMVTAAIEAGATETVIMQRTGQKSLSTMRRYVRPAGAFRADPLAGVL